MVTLEHKGFTGSLKIWPETSILYGEILNIDTQITYEGDCFYNVTIAFEAAVDKLIEEEL